VFACFVKVRGEIVISGGRPDLAWISVAGVPAARHKGPCQAGVVELVDTRDLRAKGAALELTSPFVGA